MNKLLMLLVISLFTLPLISAASIVFQDNFDRADGPLGTAPTGQVWVSGGANILNNVGYHSNATSANVSFVNFGNDSVIFTFQARTTTDPTDKYIYLNNNSQNIAGIRFSFGGSDTIQVCRAGGCVNLQAATINTWYNFTIVVPSITAQKFYLTIDNTIYNNSGSLYDFITAVSSINAINITGNTGNLTFDNMTFLNLTDDIKLTITARDVFNSSSITNFSASYLTNYCVQEFATISDSCGSLSNGSYTTIEGVSNQLVGSLSSIYDGNYNTGVYDIGVLSPGFEFFVNYSKNSIFYTATWYVKDGFGEKMVDIPTQCFQQPNIQLKAFSRRGGFPSESATANWYCYNGSTWTLLINQTNVAAGVVNATLYEERIIWYKQQTNNVITASTTNGTIVEIYNLTNPTNITIFNAPNYFSETFYNVTPAPYIAYLTPIGVLNVTVFDENGNLFSGTVDLQILNSTSIRNLTITTGNVTLTDLVLNQAYRLIFSASGYVNSTYDIVYNVTYANNGLQAYMYPAGTTVTFIVRDTFGDSLEGALITLENFVNGTYQIVQQLATDGAGSVNFPAVITGNNRITISKSGFITRQFLSDLTLSPYTITLVPEGTSPTDSGLTGIVYNISPTNYTLYPILNTFIFEIVDYEENLEVINISIYNGTNSSAALLANISAFTDTGGTIVLPYNFSGFNNTPIKVVFSYKKNNFAPVLIERAYFISSIPNYDYSVFRARDYVQQNTTLQEKLGLFVFTYLSIIVVSAVVFPRTFVALLAVFAGLFGAWFYSLPLGATVIVGFISFAILLYVIQRDL